jgi:hypothetical protein
MLVKETGEKQLRKEQSRRKPGASSMPPLAAVVHFPPNRHTRPRANVHCPLSMQEAIRCCPFAVAVGKSGGGDNPPIPQTQIIAQRYGTVKVFVQICVML